MVIKRSEVVDRIQTLFGGGAIAGLTDVQLLERFTTLRGDEAELAFAGLLTRHGPMVLGVCRGLLWSPQDAEDAFQATFLVLARKAGSLRRPDLVGPWLNGVAHRSARQIRTGNARRRRAAEAVISSNRTGAEAVEQEFEHAASAEIEALHEEIARLPERYRMAVVLCDLQGLTHEEAARRLGRPVGTLECAVVAGSRAFEGPVEPPRHGFPGHSGSCGLGRKQRVSHALCAGGFDDQGRHDRIHGAKGRGGPGVNRRSFPRGVEIHVLDKLENDFGRFARGRGRGG